ncbi:glycoside hydrolase [Aeoliella sp. ICT_H6.2]|uniref:Glycoside hydrolase n=1 Tax=Aeoliella straminimaris TaxID=2954799 RepID=A0A9X2JG60_9BACT|nr:sialidase family protein [Aeoliella straminimaris]MCO6044740.1 glycoside hydrolase [Aeoliella straminimaris]
MARQEHRQVVVDREPGQYLGHPTTVLLEDGRTMFAVYPKGHGRGAIVMKRSDDGGETWSDRLPTPQSWTTSKETPTIHRVVDGEGSKRLILWSGLYPARLSVSENDGKSWSELKAAGDWGGIVVMGFVEPLSTPGHYLAMFHDDGRFRRKQPTKQEEKAMTLYKTLSEDGGRTWSEPEEVWSSEEIHLCEPGCIRSPDGEQLAVLLRENRRRKNSHVIFSNDEGETWTEPRQLPLALSGDRHVCEYGPDGRLFISFRCVSPKPLQPIRPFEGDWVAWVGSYDDLVNNTEGQYFVRLGDNTKAYDTAYPGVEILPDGTFVAITYGHWDKNKQPYILSVRLKLSELDELSSDLRN